MHLLLGKLAGRDDADSLRHVDTGLLAKPATHTMLGVNNWRLIQTKFHRLSRQRTGAVAHAAGATSVRVADILQHHGGAHADSLASNLGGLEWLQCARGADLCAGHAKDTGLGSCSDNWRSQACQPCLQSCQSDTLVRTNIRALTTTDAGREKSLLLLSPRWTKVTPQSARAGQFAQEQNSERQHCTGEQGSKKPNSTGFA